MDKSLEIMEEIINEVSVKKWKEAAKNSIEGRNQKANDASDSFGEVVYPFRGEVNDPGHKRGDKWGDAEHRLHRAKELAKNLPDSNKSANKVVKAAKNSVEGRNKANDEASKNLNKAANDYKSKKEHTEADRKELVKVQNKWVDTQKKEDTAHHILNKPVRRHERQADGSYKLKADKFAGLNANEAFDLMEEIINEVSVGLLKRAAESSYPARKAESEKIIENPEGKSKSERKMIRHKVVDAGRVKSALDKYSNDNKTQANKLINAAKKVTNDRKEDSRNFRDVTHPDSWTKFTRSVRAEELSRIGKTPISNLSKTRKTLTNEALDIMEDIYDAIEKRHGEPRGDYNGQNRAADLFDKVRAAKNKVKETRKGDTNNEYTPKSIRKTGEMFLNTRTDKNSSGRQLTLRRQPETVNGKPREHWEKTEAEGIQSSIRRHNDKMNKNEALDVLEEIFHLSGSLFEVEGVETEEVPPSTNKIKRTKKDKKSGEETEVVSVADELFPYEGNAKEQFNQKVLAKINDMIEGTGTLEDLMQFVRKGAKKSKANESLEVEQDSVTEALVIMNEIMEELNNSLDEDLRSTLDADFHDAANYLLGGGKRGLQKLSDRITRGHHEKRFQHHANEYNNAMAQQAAHKASGNHAGAELASLQAKYHKEKMGHHYGKVQNGGGHINLNISTPNNQNANNTTTNQAQNNATAQKPNYMKQLRQQSARYQKASAAYNSIKNNKNFDPAKRALIQSTMKNAKSQMNSAANNISKGTK